MSPVSFGASLGSFGAGLVPGPMLVEWAQEIERLGFETLWCRDHVLWHSPVLDPFTVLGAMAASTSRIRLGPGVLLLPLRGPVLVAKAMASLDFVSGGRAVLGIGVGGEFPEEYAACGVALRERGRRADEAIEAIRALWSPGPATYKGKFYQFEQVVMEPHPVQAPHPPIWVGGRSDAALRRAGSLGDGWLAYFVTPERFQMSLDKVLEHWQKRGKAEAGFGAGLVMYIRVAPTYEEAKREAVRYLTTEYHQPFEDLVDKYCALGPASDCMATLSRFIDAGARHIALIPTCPPSVLVEQLRQIAAEIAPHFARGSGMLDDLRRWATEIGESYEEIALILLAKRSGEAAVGEPLRICLVMKDGEKVPWFVEAKGVDGLAYGTVPGRETTDRILADERLRRPGLQLYMNFCDPRALMFTYREGKERLAGEEVVDFRYRMLYPERDKTPPLEEFFHLWGDRIDVAP